MKPAPRSVLLLAAALAVLGGCQSPDHAMKKEAPERPRIFTGPEKGPYETLVWEQEFDGEGLPDPAVWIPETGGHGWGNRELQFYTAGRTENARQEDGVLVIEARREAWEENEYTSARLVTRYSTLFQYGRIEMRAKLPTGRGVWPALWMLTPGRPHGGWPHDGEIDIMEFVGFEGDRVHGTIHTGAYNHMKGTHKNGQADLPDPQAWNVYAIEWEAGEIRWYLNGEPYFTYANDGAGDPETWPFDRPFYLLVNLAVGGSWGGMRGVDESIFPQRYTIDYIRVYQ